MDWLSKDDVIERFMHGDDVMASWVDLRSLANLISRALVIDSHPITEAMVWDKVIVPPMQEDGPNQSLGNDDRFQPPTVVYLHYADWEANISRLLGVDPDADIQPDWRKDNPHTYTVVQAMASVGMEVSRAASAAYQAQHGHSMIEVFLASAETGEDFDQARTRLTTQRRGLQVIKWPAPSGLFLIAHLTVGDTYGVLIRSV